MKALKFWNKPRFENADVMQATGLSASTVQTWVNRGLFRPTSGQNPGYGTRRQYTTGEVIWLSLMGAMRDLGSASFAAKVVLAIDRSNMGIGTVEAIANRPSAIPFWTVVSTGKNGEPKASYVTTDAQQLAQDLRGTDGSVLLILDLGRLIHPVIAKLEEILRAAPEPAA